MFKKKKSGDLRIIESTPEKIFNVATVILGLIISAVVIYPIYYVFIASISRPFYVESGSVMFWPEFFTLESYRQVFQIRFLWSSYGNTIFYTVAGVAVAMFITTTMAYALSKKRLIFRKGFTLFVVFTMWFSAGIIPTYQNFVNLGLRNTRTAIVFGFAVSAYNLVIMKSFFEQLPEELEEAAFVDGASNLKIFWSIFMPLSKPALATVGMFYAVVKWNSYFWAMNLLTDDLLLPLQVLLKKQIVDQVASANEAAIITQATLSSPTTVIYALIIVAIVPMLIVYPFVQKYFKTGMTLGGVKG